MRYEDPSNTRRNFLEQLKPLTAHRRFANGKTGYIPTRSRKARDEAIADRIRNDCENDRDNARLLQQSVRSVRVLRKKQVWLQRDEFLRVSLNSLSVGGCKIARLHDDVRPAEPLEFPPEDGKAGLYLPIALGCRHQHANSSYPARLLRPANSWPCRSSAECRNELSPFHVPPPMPWGDTIGSFRSGKEIDCEAAQ